MVLGEGVELVCWWLEGAERRREHEPASRTRLQRNSCRSYACFRTRGIVREQSAGRESQHRSAPVDALSHCERYLHMAAAAAAAQPGALCRKAMNDIKQATAYRGTKMVRREVQRASGTGSSSRRV